MKNKPVAEQEIAKQLLQETISYAESSVCRHRQLLHYFGEGYPKENCGACDNCLNPKEQFEGKENVQLVIESVLAVKQLFKREYLVNILVGDRNADIKNAKHDKLDVFGQGIDYDGLDDGSSGRGAVKTDALDAMLFNMLKDLRRDISKKNNLPPFVIFQDPSLEDMTIQYPTTLEELKSISGVGVGKAAKYGEPFVRLIKNYVEENEIIRPVDMVVKSVVNKSGMKVFIIKSIDKKLPLEVIARSKNLSVEDLITEIEHIVSAGTKLDLTYYINETIDEYHQEDILEYFSEAESDSLEDALEELGEDEFSEEEIRLMRIKYMSDVGN